MGFFGRDRWETDALIRISAQIREIEHKVNDIIRKAETIMATQAELAAKLTSIGDELDKAKTEIDASIQALKDALASAGSTTPEVDAAVTRLEGSAKALDDLNPDV